ncbi:hypothetical protein N7539_008708 [Penicillium diatomitis]|uniref:Uncharacterized protein n=1 Tax=Penicillium diatomitis TaxID=2819901 RepID=A0A9W9WRA1_9EURO|nr:uncharacterized protein N7539_008708 [Penicillium diatomitis]KAJ5472139.1 hypothetical protein N7539_008708 [Penicillium diatomitis]
MESFTSRLEPDDSQKYFVVIADVEEQIVRTLNPIKLAVFEGRDFTPAVYLEIVPLVVQLTFQGPLLLPSVALSVFRLKLCCVANENLISA